MLSIVLIASFPASADQLTLVPRHPVHPEQLLLVEADRQLVAGVLPGGASLVDATITFGRHDWSEGGRLVAIDVGAADFEDLMDALESVGVSGFADVVTFCVPMQVATPHHGIKVAIPDDVSVCDDLLTLEAAALDEAGGLM